MCACVLVRVRVVTVWLHGNVLVCLCVGLRLGARRLQAGRGCVAYAYCLLCCAGAAARTWQQSCRS